MSRNTMLLVALTVLAGVAVGYALSAFTRGSQSQGARPASLDTKTTAIAATEAASPTTRPLVVVTPEVSASPTAPTYTPAALSSTPTPEVALQVPVTPTPVSATPTAVPAGATPHATPTASPSPASTSVASPTPSPSEILLRRVAAQEASLRSGRLSAVLNLGEGQKSVAEVLFDVGKAEPRLRTSTTYTSAQGSRTLERITVGARAWQRLANGSWSAASEEEGVLGRLRSYLPGAAAAEDVRLESADPRTSTLRWYDPSRDADVAVDVDVATGVPLSLSRVARATRSILTVNYVGWNTPAEIEPPGGR